MKHPSTASSRLSKARAAAPAGRGAAKTHSKKVQDDLKPTAWGVAVLKKIESFRRALAAGA